MTSLLFLVPVALGLGFLGLLAFIWSLKNGQYDDLEGAGERILIDDGPLPADREREKGAKDKAHRP